MMSVKGIFNWILGSKTRVLVFLLSLLAIGFLGFKQFTTQTASPTYQTAEAEKGSLTTSVSASGTVSQASGATITTQASGIVKTVYVQDGDIVTPGQKIADLTLDISSQQKQAAAWASYLSAKNSLASAQNTLNSLNSTMWQSQQKLINDAAARGLATDNPTYIEQNSDWLKAENDYKNQQNIIIASQASLNSSWLAYSQLSPIIVAPMSGTISGLNLTPGMTISSSTSTDSTTTSLGTITLKDGLPQVTVNLTEIDVVKVKTGQKAILTLDALPEQSFTGVVAAINTNGVVSSNVTTYPCTITFDTETNTIYPNMAVSATIITNIKNDVVLVPSGAVLTSNNTSTVRILKDNQVSSIEVEIGDSNDTQTQIISGINVGDTVITAETSASSSSTGTTTSPFGATNRGFGGGGGFGVIRR